MYNDTLIFPSDNELGIPTLRMDRQAQWIEKPCLAWGSVSRKADWVKTWHFYSDDYRWSKLIKQPWDLLPTRPVICCEMNISIFDDSPAALALAEIYKKRLASRLWQERGIEILVDLYVPERLMDWNLLGVPAGWKAYSTRASAKRVPELDMRFERAKAHAGTDNILFAVFGGGEVVADWCQQTGATHVPYAAKKRPHSW